MKNIQEHKHGIKNEKGFIRLKTLILICVVLTVTLICLF